MSGSIADIVICGAGMAGVSAAYHLAVKRGIRNVVLVDEREPLTLTSDKGTQAYRNWWPGPDDTMMRFINHSIDLMEAAADECGNLFEMNRRGYVFLTADQNNVSRMKQAAEAVSALGAGPFRIHPGDEKYLPAAAEGFLGEPAGIDFVLEPELILKHFPFITPDVVAMCHVRRCGWLDSVSLGKWLLRRSRDCGTRLVRDRVESIDVKGGRVRAIGLRSGGRIHSDTFVLAAGPLLNEAAAMLDLNLPVLNELHGKVVFRDRLGVVPSSAPMMLWNDPTCLQWTESERKELMKAPETRFLLDEFPEGVHFRPRGAGEAAELLMIWTYDTSVQEPVWPLSFHQYYSDVCLRGLARMIPGLRAYFGEAVEARIDGGYYCKTRDNRPLIGPLPITGAYVIAALSGYGIMGSLAAGELLADHVAGAALPEYASAFRAGRFDDPAYQAVLDAFASSSGQL